MDLALIISSWILEKLNQRLCRSDCGSAIVGKAGESCLELEDDELIVEKLSNSANVDKSCESKTKGEGSSGLSSNIVTNGGRRWGEKEARRGLTLSRDEAYSSCATLA